MDNLNKLLFLIFYVAGSISFLVCVLVFIQFYRMNRQKHVLLEMKINSIQISLDGIKQQLNIIESKVGDINVRVSMAEVRLEERKSQHQLLLPGPSRRGRKPKIK